MVKVIKIFKQSSGITLLMLTVSIFLISVTLTLFLPRANKELQREKEDQLRFRLSELNNATKRFIASNKRAPQNLDELIQDSSGRRFLRQKYKDPFTKKSDWVIDQNASPTPIIHSISEKLSISGIPYSNFR